MDTAARSTPGSDRLPGSPGSATRQRRCPFRPPALGFPPRGSGGTGRRAGFRFLSRKGWGFESPLPHHLRGAERRATVLPAWQALASIGSSETDTLLSVWGGAPGMRRSTGPTRRAAHGGRSLGPSARVRALGRSPAPSARGKRLGVIGVIAAINSFEPTPRP
jgi:hypothetical protein